ncbi:HAD-IA family hydrolase [Microbacterium sp. CJ88]|uniref:HAD-IA family hydrolase n=1 Tax=Microbacterium sp. CJ88 TaxID=3445672 RepID=UPI003F65650D
MSDPAVIVVAGVAGTGKSTLGRALATRLRMPLLDLDAVTNPLLDALPASVFDGHWLSSPLAGAVRSGRYAALRAVAADAVATAGGAVLVAPFTAELRGGAEWGALVAAVAPVPVRVVHLTGDAGLLAARRGLRGEERDAHRPEVEPLPPAVPVIPIDAELTTTQQLLRLLPALGVRTEVDASAPLFARDFDAVLFDLDGTLIDSTASVNRSWRRFAEHYAVSAEALHANHGQPARVLISKLLPSELHEEGLARVTSLEVDDAVDLEPIRGAHDFFQSVPAGRRAIVTSGSVPIATARLASAGFAQPDVFVTADDVTRGKPDPEPFLTAAARLGVDPARCLVVEDAVAGIAAARAAGCAVLAITGTVEASALPGDVVVDGLDRIALEVDGGVLRLRAVV